jgi:plastocyanin
LPICLVFAAAAVLPGRQAARAQSADVGTIKGQVKLTGKPPGNPIIRMGVDPMCVKVNAGKRVIQEEVVAGADGGLANVFVSVQGKFAAVPVPAQSVAIDQRGCVYLPRMVGARVGQTLEVRNSDALLHNVHTVSRTGNDFNIGQPMAGMVYKYQLKSEEIVVRLRCDIHRWMAAYIGVVSHPYYAVSASGGGFEIRNVPAGKYTVRAWHERYGEITQSVQVARGATATVSFAYTGTEKPPTARILDLVVPSAPESGVHAALDFPAGSRHALTF